MSLEPVEARGGQFQEKAELGAMMSRFWASAALSAPVEGLADRVQNAPLI